MVWAKSLDEGLTALRDATVTELKFSYQIGVEGTKQIAEALKHNTTLTTLDFQTNEIGAEGAKQIADALKQNKTLSTLHLSSNHIGAEGAKHIAERLKHNTTLTTLTLDYNSIDAEEAKHIADALKQNTILITLNLSANYIGDKGAKHIANALQHNTALTTLDLAFNYIGVEGAKHVAEALKHNTTLTSLNLSNNCSIGDNGAKHIAEALKHNTTLTELILEKSFIGAEGVKHVAEGLKHNKTLKVLYLYRNTAKDIVSALTHNTTLTTLNLHTNEIGVEGAKDVAEALKQNKTLSTLHLECNEIGDEGAKHIAEGLEHNTTLTTLNLDWNKIGNEGAEHITGALTRNTTLTTLSLGSNYIGRKGAMCIAEAIKYNTALANLDLTYNKIGRKGVESVEEAVKESLALRWCLQKWPKPTSTNTRKMKQLAEQLVDDLSAKLNVIDCSVCMDPKDQLLLLPCLHPVCTQCLQDVKNISPCVCRVCQEPFSVDLVLPHHTATPNTAIYCSQHLDNNATKFCFDCNVLVCIACDHDASHQLYDLEEAMKRILDDLLVQLDQVDEAIEYIVFARSAALNKLASIKSAIQLSFEALNNPELASQHDELLEQAQTIANDQVKILDMQNEDLIAAKDARETALQQARNLMVAGVTPLRVYSMVLGRIQLLLNNPPQLEPFVFDLLRFEQLDSDNNPIGYVFENEPQLYVEIDRGNEEEEEEEE